MGGATPSTRSAFQSTVTPAFWMAARRTRGLGGTLYEAASASKLLGKLLVGRGGYGGLTFGGGGQREKRRRRRSAREKRAVAVSYEREASVTCSEEAALSPRGRRSAFTGPSFGSSHCVFSTFGFVFSR